MRFITVTDRVSSLELCSSDCLRVLLFLFFFFQAEDGIRDLIVTGVQTCAVQPLRPKGLDAAVPQPPPPGTPPPPPDELNKTIVISIDKAGNLKINQDNIELRYLGDQLQEIFKTRNERTAFVNADPELLYKDVVEVIDVAKGAGVDKIGLITEQIQAGK